MNEDKPSKIIYTGWILAVIITFVFLVWARNYYYRIGYNEGQKQQFAIDISKVERDISLLRSESINFLNGKVGDFRQASHSFSLDVLDSPPNPLITYPVRRDVLFDDQTPIFIRQSKTPGVYSESPAKFEDLKAGDYVKVFSSDSGLVSLNSFKASRVIIVGQLK